MASSAGLRKKPVQQTTPTTSSGGEGYGTTVCEFDKTKGYDYPEHKYVYGKTCFDLRYFQIMHHLIINRRLPPSEGNEVARRLTLAVIPDHVRLKCPSDECTCESDECPKWTIRYACPPGSCNPSCRMAEVYSLTNEDKVECCINKYGIRGLRATKFIEPDEPVIIYAGEVLTFKQSVERMAHYKDVGFKDNYQALNRDGWNTDAADFYVDCTQAGNIAGLANSLTRANNCTFKTVSCEIILCIE